MKIFRRLPKLARTGITVFVIGAIGAAAALIAVAHSGSEKKMPATSTPVSALDCMKFISDITIPDTSALPSGTTQGKTWEVTNCGNTTWSGYKLMPTVSSGNPAGLAVAAHGSVTVPAVKPGETANITVPLTVPTQKGEYLIVYELSNDGTHRFGDPLWIEFLSQ